jgi:hypothetical protein
MIQPETFRSAAQSTTRLSLADLLRLHGESSPAVLLLVLSVLCVLPVYGVGTALSFAILAMAWRWGALTQGSPGSGLAQGLTDRLGQLSLGEAWSRRCLHGLAWMYATAGRCLRTRWTVLCHPRTGPWWGLWIALMGLVIFLPLPFGNVLPSISLVLLSLGWMFRDGLALLASAVVGSGAVAFTVTFGHLAWEAFLTVRSWLGLGA